MSTTDVKAISQLKCLRTLRLSRNGIVELPEELGELIHLRYLDLSENEELEKLPESLGNLYNLQSLSLDDCHGLRTLPENMGNLINLRHLGNGCIRLQYLPRGIARLTSLQTLTVCPVMEDSGPDEAFKLGNLGSLDQLQGTLIIRIKGDLNDDATSEAQKARMSSKKLYHLSVRFATLEEQSHLQTSDDVQVLEALRPHQDLESLGIARYCGTTAPSWMITCLQNLKFLYLDVNFCLLLGNCPSLKT
ncbi:hypothetical protein ACLB2K_045853 [Fragaria x ananassa]